MRRIFLVGMPGCGKSTLARALAAAGVADTLDIDAMVEAEASCSVAELIRTRGEAAFRKMEAEAVARAVAAAPQGLPLVVSTGGGVPCHGDNMERMLHAGTVVWLQASRARSLERLADAPGQRPMADEAMAGGRLGEWFDALLDARRSHYGRAHACFDTTELDDAAAVAAAVCRFTQQFGL